MINCGFCAEEIKQGEECQCPGSKYCTCEFEHHHAGCCEDYEDLIEHVASDNKLDLDTDPWAPVAYVEMAVLDAHDEYLR